MIAFADRASRIAARDRKPRVKAAKSNRSNKPIDFPALVVLIQAAAGQLNAPVDLPVVRPGGRLAEIEGGDGTADVEPDGELTDLVDTELAGLSGALPTVGYDEVRGTLLKLLGMVDGLGL